MTEVAFHFNAPDKLAYVCRLARKARNADFRIVILAQDGAQLAELDDRMWTFSEQDFLPHVKMDDALAVQTPILLTDDPAMESPHHQILINLMDNAIKFAAPGSTLCVSLWKSEGKAYVSVRDHGETIPPDDLPFIFDRFHKSDRSRSLDRDGVGLGLYLVKSILDAHGEDIAVTSRDGVTEFVFTLTLAKPAPKPTAKPESTGRRGGRKSS